MNNMMTGIVTILVAVIGVAMLATLVSKNAQTPAVLKAGGSAFGEILRAATGPVSGGFSMPSLNF
jgi:hypothetical protein